MKQTAIVRDDKDASQQSAYLTILMADGDKLQTLGTIIMIVHPFGVEILEGIKMDREETLVDAMA